MNINTKSLVSMSEANQNFSKVARLVDKHGAAVVLKNNRPQYVILEYSQLEQSDAEETPTEIDVASDDDVLAASRQLMARNRHVYEVLAQ